MLVLDSTKYSENEKDCKPKRSRLDIILQLSEYEILMNNSSKTEAAKRVAAALSERRFHAGTGPAAPRETGSRT
ncbi:hypothetical protein AV530_019678 [Patagioenas fasciata monilis]|uniref:Uncharacterized protein n=1 Tax=Patagioenas fasciata monilis TaxID=372326 RepID=A0A1V4JET8_PATFA|nr:hypothetical protein AV530_019678 [Patagioenas fasciata monilis]